MLGTSWRTLVVPDGSFKATQALERTSEGIMIVAVRENKDKKTKREKSKNKSDKKS